MSRAASLSLGVALALAGSARVVSAEPAPAGERASLHWVELTLKAGDRERAVRGLARALRRTPTPLLAQRYAELALPLSAASSEAERKKLVRSAELLLEVLEQRASQGEPWPETLGIRTAWALALRGDLGDSISLVERTGAHDAEQALRCLRAIATLALQRGAPTSAVQALLLARAFAPTDRLLKTELGLLLLARGEVLVALPLLAERFASEPSLLGARRDYAYALSAAGRPPEAYAVLKGAEDSCRTTELCSLELSRFAYEAGRYDEARRELDALLVRWPLQLPALFLLADTHVARAENAAARSVYQRILDVAPDNLRARAALAGLGADLGDTRAR